VTKELDALVTEVGPLKWIRGTRESGLKANNSARPTFHKDLTVNSTFLLLGLAKSAVSRVLI